MATLTELQERGRLEEVEDISLVPGQKRRELYIMVPEASDDVRRVVGRYTATWNPSLSISDQMVQLFHDFISGKSLHHPEDFHVLLEVEDGIWELKTDDVRFFGWFPDKDNFVIATVGYADMVKDGKYASFISTALFRRKDLALNDGKFIQGEEPNNVISHFHTA